MLSLGWSCSSLAEEGGWAKEVGVWLPPPRAPAAKLADGKEGQSRVTTMAGEGSAGQISGLGRGW